MVLIEETSSPKIIFPLCKHSSVVNMVREALAGAFPASREAFLRSSSRECQQQFVECNDRCGN
jgi:hypothetical protein